MAIEIERKFLLSSEDWRQETDNGVRIKQGYFNNTDNFTLRVRTFNARAYLTIKGPSNGLSRSEFEYEIPLLDAQKMFQEFCGTRIVEKIRYQIPEANGVGVWEIDEYLGDNLGLFTAELELPSEETSFVKPQWLGEEVTTVKKYSNGSLSRHPYNQWPLEEK